MNGAVRFIAQTFETGPRDVHKLESTQIGEAQR